jgi:hypothetical protein
MADLMEVSADQLQRAVEGQYGGKAVLVGAERVKETLQGKTVWEGTLHVFDLERHPKATRAYAWSSPIEGSDDGRFYSVLHLGAIRCPLDAVRAAIAAERRRFDGDGPEDKPRRHERKRAGRLPRNARRRSKYYTWLAQDECYRAASSLSDPSGLDVSGAL